jgi:multidrug efflux pump subunit AcrB
MACLSVMEIVMNCNNRGRNKGIAFLVCFLVTVAPALTAPAPAKPGPVVQVITCYPGMPAAAIEKTITNRIERWVNQAPGVRTIQSRSIAGVSIVYVHFREDINTDSALTNTGKLALSTLPTLPANTLPPLVLPASSRLPRPVGVLSVYGADGNEEELMNTTRSRVREGLSRIEGAMLPVLLGGKKRVVHIHLDPKALQAHNLPVLDVVKALQKGKALSEPDNYFILGKKDEAIYIHGKTLKFNQLKALPILDSDGKTVRLGDIGRIEDGYEPQTVIFRFQGRTAVGVPIYPAQGTNGKTLAERIAKRLADLQKRMPDKTKVAWVPFSVVDKEGQAGDDLLTISVRAPSNARLADTEKRVAAVERLVEKSIPAKERVAILSELGVTPDYTAAYTANAGPMDATIFVQLSRDRKLSAAAYAAKLRRGVHIDPQFADLSFRFASLDMPVPLVVRIKDGKPEEQQQLAKKVSQRLATIKGTVDVDIAQRRDASFLVIKVNRDKAAAVGLTSRDVLTQALAAVQPRASLDREFWIEAKSGKQFSITVPFPNKTLDDLLNVELHGANQNTPIKLSSLASLQRITAAVEIDHLDLSPVLDVRANIEERNRRDVMADIRKMIVELQVPAGMKVELANEP